MGIGTYRLSRVSTSASIAVLSSAVLLSACTSSGGVRPGEFISQAQAQLEGSTSNLALNEQDDLTPNAKPQTKLGQAKPDATTALTADARAEQQLNVLPSGATRISQADTAPAVGTSGSLVATNGTARQTGAAQTAQLLNNSQKANPLAAGGIATTATALAPQKSRKNGFFDRLFGSSAKPKPAVPLLANAGAAPQQPVAATALAQTNTSADKLVVASAQSVQAKKAAPVKVKRAAAKPVAKRASQPIDDLPGVRKKQGFFASIFGNSNRRKSTRSNSSKAVKVASVAGFARISPNGLLRQHAGVRVNCFKPSLMRILRKVERRYGKKVIVTSGYRSTRQNRRAGGARNSRHIFCDGADIQVSGVSKWQLAKYLRSLPGRGGVGTYCHTKSVHIDTYKVRDWNWRCRRSKRRRG